MKRPLNRVTLRPTQYAFSECRASLNDGVLTGAMAIVSKFLSIASTSYSIFRCFAIEEIPRTSSQVLASFPAVAVSPIVVGSMMLAAGDLMVIIRLSSRNH